MKPKSKKAFSFSDALLASVAFHLSAIFVYALQPTSPQPDERAYSLKINLSTAVTEKIENEQAALPKEESREVPEEVVEELPSPKPEPKKETVKKVEKKKPKEVVEEVKSTPVERARLATPREQNPAAVAEVRSQSQVRYEDLVLSLLEKKKRYPRIAKRRQLEGVAHLRLSIKRDGEVIAASVESSSNHSLLDSEVLKMVERASPFPPFPEELSQGELVLLIPVEFKMLSD